MIKPLIRDIEEAPIQEYYDLEEPQGLIETPQNMISTKRRLAWACDVINEEKEKESIQTMWH